MSVVLCSVVAIQACTNREIVGPSVSTVTVAPSAVTMREGDTLTFTATARDDGGRILPPGADFVWSTDDPLRLSVDADGKVEALLRGVATVSATFGGATGSATVTVTAAADFDVSAASGPTSESGGQATFTVALTEQPAGDVTVGLSVSDTTEAELSTDQLTFTPLDWDAQTVTVTGRDDDVDDGDQSYTVFTAPAVSVDPRYDTLDPMDVSLTNIDDESAGFTISAPSRPTTESGGTATFTIRLNSQPTADVTIALASSDTTEGRINSDSLTFTEVTWSVAQTVTVTGQDDALADGNIDYSVVTAPATSSDPGYDGLDPPDVSLTNVDDETAGITVSAPSGPTNEAGGQATFSVVLNAEPAADVTIGLSSSDPGEGTISADSLTFTVANWSAPQVVTVTGQDDALADGDIPYTVVTAPATSADPGYDGLDAEDVILTNVDDDTAGVLVSAPSGPTSEGGGQATFTVRLSTEPTADVTIGLSSSDVTEGTVAIGSLTFTSANWAVAQTVTVTGQDDSSADGNIVYQIILAPAVSADVDYDGTDPADVQITNVDDETAGVTVSAASGPTNESGTVATFTMVLNTRPDADVTIGIASGDTSEGIVSTSSITFTPADWDIVQTVSVTGQDDDVADGDVAFLVTTAPATSADALYNGIDPDDVSITNVDNETAGVTVSPISAPTTEAGGTATFTLVLNSQPAADVTISLFSSDSTEGTVTAPPGNLVTFTSANWNTPQPVEVTGEDDQVVDGNRVYAIVTGATQSTDPVYSGLVVADVSVTNVDDETPSITVSPISRATSEMGDTASFTVSLANQPQGDVTIGLSSSDPTEGTVSTASLTFTTLNWASPQRVVVTGVDDAIDDQNVVYTIVTAPSVSAGDANYHGIDAADVLVTNVDDDVAGISISAVSGPTTEGGAPATFTIALTSQPAADVIIGLMSNDTTEGVVASPAGGSLTFTSANWSVPQTVTVTGQDDDADDGNVQYTISVAVSSADGQYAMLSPAPVSLTNVDDEIAGITVTPVSGPTTEAGGTATFTVVLDSEPTANVTIGLSSSNTDEGTVNPASLTFTSGNWSTAQTVTVTGVDDDVDDGDIGYQIVTAAATSTDPGYSGLDAADVLVTNTDDDDAGITVSPASGPTTEAGGTATFTVVLDSEPTADVTIGLSSSDTDEGTVDPTSLTFTSGNWSTGQTVTVTGVDDDVDDDNVMYQIVTAPAVSADPMYNGRDAADASVTNIDDETAGFVVSPPSGPTTEAGGTATFTVRLTSEPVADVVIGLSSNDLTEGTVSPASLTFEAGNWNTPQTVTATGVNDDVADGNIMYQIVTAAATSADSKYDNLDPDDASITNVDDETPGITVGPASGPTTEGGGQATFAVVLNTEPTADVTIGLTSNDPTEGTVAPASLTFTPANWDTAQTVTVTGVDDDVDDDNQGYLIVTAPATSTDPIYDERDASDVSVTNVDDDVAGFAVSAPSGPTNENGLQATFSVALTSEPTADVMIGISSGDVTEGTVNPTSLTFDATNWSSAQTVTVTGVNDDIDDDITPYSVVTAAAVSLDLKYNGLNPADVPMISIDDADTRGITVSPTSGLSTSEAGGFDTFTIVLNSEPVANVTIGVSSGNPLEGSVSPTSVTFTAVNWDTPRTITVTGVNDDIDDGDVAYTILTGAASSTDPLYAGLDPADVSVTNIDDDTAGITVTPTTGLTTTEATGTAQFTVVLDSEPLANVTIGLSSSDTGEGTVSPTSLTFATDNWDTPRTVTVTGVNDDIDDGDQPYTIQTAAATSGDANYDNFNAADVSVTNTDDDTAGFTIVQSADTTIVTEQGGGMETDAFTVVLDTEPISNVVINVVSTNTAEATVDQATLTFTSADWDQPQEVIVTGGPQGSDDGDQFTPVLISVDDASSDIAFHGLTDQITVQTIDIP